MAPHFVTTSYGMIEEDDQTYLVVRRQTRKRVIVMVVSAVFLVAIIVFAVVVGAFSQQGSHSKPADSGNAGRPPSLSTSVKAVCATTLYPVSCYNTISPRVNSSSPDPALLLNLAIEVAMDGVTKAVKRLEDMGGAAGALDDDKSGAALMNCKELLGLSLDELEDTLAPADLTSAEVVDDLKTWLSAALTNLDTCVDGFDDVAGAAVAKNKVIESLRNATEFTSNSLAILTAICNFVENLKLRRRLLNYEQDPAKYPSAWLPPSSRKLLLESSHDPRAAADVVVAKDGSGNYTTIGEALASVPERLKTRFVVYVKKGVYVENVKVGRNQWYVTMVGDGMNATVVSGSLNVFDGTPTYSTATFAVLGKGFIAKDMGFRNTAGANKFQAVAVMSASDTAVFYRCRFEAYQDTLYAQSMRQFYRECDIYGTVDFIFGNAAAVFQSCNILPRVPIPGQMDVVTAQGKSDLNQNTGTSIHNCTVRPSGNLASVKVFLGRPWKPYSTTVFMRTVLPDIIDPAGWLPWTGTTAPDTVFYSEYKNSGAGAATKDRVKWKGVNLLNATQASKFSVGSFFGSKSWISRAGVPFTSRV